MAEEKMTEKEKEANEKEDVRQIQLGILNSEGVRNLYIASQGRDIQRYGNAGKIATQTNYINALANPDEHVSRITTMPYLQSALKAQEKGSDIYESDVSASHLTLLKNTAGVYRSAINKVKVSDILEMIQWENVHEKNISETQKGMYLEDFKEANEEMYKILVSSYFGTVEDTGVGQAIIERRVQENKGLEKILAEDPDKLKEENKERTLDTNYAKAA